MRPFSFARLKETYLLLLLTLCAITPTPVRAQAPPFVPTPVVAFVNNGGGWSPWTAGTGANPVAATPLSVALYCQISTGATWTPCNPNASGNGVVAINGVPGSFTFLGNGVACSATTCTFNNGGGTIYNFATPPSSWPSWLQPTVTNPTSSVSLAVTATAIPNSALANDWMSVNTVVCTLGQACSIDVGTGTVTSVNATVPPWLAVSGVPITTNGTIAITAASEPAGYFVASPASATGALVARPIAVSDVPTLNQNTTGQAGTVGTIHSMITPGSAVTLTGNGTVASPYNIAVTAATFSFPGIVYATSATEADIATSAQMQAAIGADVYDFYGAAADVQALALQRSNNLSDLNSASTARANLGLGTLATQAATAISVTGGALTGVTVNGVTLQTAGSSALYLNAAGTYTTPAGGGSGTGTVTSVSVTSNNGVSGTVTNPTTAANITLTLGAITPTSIATTGTISGAAITGTSFNGVALTNAGSATTYLNAAGGYTTPAGSGGSGFPITIGTTSIAASSTTTAIAGLSVNGVTLETSGAAGLYLAGTGTYKTPPGPMLYTVNYHAAGSDLCAWIGAAMAALPSTGGSVSTAGEANFASTNTCSAANEQAMYTASYGNTGKFTHLYADAQTLELPVQLRIPYGSEISGSNVGYPSYSGSVLQASTAYVASAPFTAVACSGTTQLCTVTTSSATNLIVGSQILMVPATASNVPPFAQEVTAVLSSTQFQFPEWVNCNVSPNTVNCAGGSNYPASTYASLTTGTVIVPLVAVGDIQFSELTRLDHFTIDMGNVAAGQLSIGYFSQTMNELSGSVDLTINNTTYSGFDIEAGANSATLGAGNFQFEQFAVGPTAGVCGRVVEAYANDMRGIHDGTCNGYAASAPLAQGIVFDGPDGANGPFHFENVVDGVVLQGSFAMNAAGTAGSALGEAFSVYDVNCFTGITNCVHNKTSTNTPTNFTLRDIKSNGATNVYMNAAGAANTAQYLSLFVDGAVNLTSGSLAWGGGAAIPSSSSVCSTVGCAIAIAPTSVAATGAVSGSTVAASGTSNGEALLTYTGTLPTAPTTNQFALTAAVAISTPYSLSVAPIPTTGVMYGTLTGSTVQQTYTLAPPLMHIVSVTAAPPTIGSGSGAGTSPTIGISSTATDLTGYISVTTGTTPVAGGVVVQVNLHVPFANQPKCFTWPANGAAASLTGTSVPYIQDGSVQDNSFQLQSGSTALIAATLYEWGYMCVQ